MARLKDSRITQDCTGIRMTEGQTKGLSDVCVHVMTFPACDIREATRIVFRVNLGSGLEKQLLQYSCHQKFCFSINGGFLSFLLRPISKFSGSQSVSCDLKGESHIFIHMKIRSPRYVLAAILIAGHFIIYIFNACLSQWGYVAILIQSHNFHFY